MWNNGYTTLASVGFGVMWNTGQLQQKRMTDRWPLEISQVHETTTNTEQECAALW